MKRESGRSWNFETHEGISETRRSGTVFGLCTNLQMAAKIAQAAKHCHLSAHNFDSAGPLLAQFRVLPPILVILDWDTCEAQAFKFLKETAYDAEMKHVPVIGYLSSGTRTPLREEAQHAGCHRVYTKSEFFRDIEMILARYAQ
jgi:hypothetical protein